MRKEMIAELEEYKIIGIFRGVTGENLINSVQALIDGGIHFIEITYNQKAESKAETLDSIKLLKDHFKDKIRVGAGTVLNKEQVQMARAAGAEFIVAPNVCKEVIDEAHKYDMLCCPGACTCTEVVQAHDYGADFVKLFPAGTLGIKYSKDLIAPINHVRYLTTSGINEEIFEEFLKIGFSGAGVRGRLTDEKLINEGNFEEMTRRSKKFVEIAKKY